MFTHKLQVIAEGGNQKQRIGCTPIIIAAEYDQPAILTMLLEAGADPNTSDVKGMSALYTAANCGNLRAGKVLVEAGADINAQVLRGQSVISIAAGKDHLAFVEYLLSLDGIEVDGGRYAFTLTR